MKILCINDLHFAKQNPTSRIDDYNGELHGLLHQVLLLTRHFQCSAVCIAGDIFHNKGVVGWEVVIKLLEWGREVQKTCGIYTIMGNHDQQHDRMESIGQTPYGVLIGSGLFMDISRRAVTLKANGGLTLYGVPWPDGARPDAFDNIPSGVDVVLAHGFATFEGIERWGVFCHKYADLAKAAPHVRIFHFGHDHTDHGVMGLLTGAKVINIGALARGALDTDTITRQVKVALVDIESGSVAPPVVEQIRLKQKDASEIFDLVRHQERVVEQQHLESFLDDLQSGLSGVLDVDYIEVLAAMPLDDSVRQRVRAYIEKAEGSA